MSFNRHLFKALMAPDGSTFVVEGLGGRDGNRRRIAAFDGATGSVKWSRDLKKTCLYASFASDPAGAQLGFTFTDDEKIWALVELATGKEVASLAPQLLCLGPPGCDYLVRSAPARVGGKVGLALYRREGKSLLLELGIDDTAESIQFDPSGRRLVWGNADGTVTVCEIEEVRRWLGQVGLGW